MDLKVVRPNTGYDYRIFGRTQDMTAGYPAEHRIWLPDIRPNTGYDCRISGRTQDMTAGYPTEYADMTAGYPADYEEAKFV